MQNRLNKIDKPDALNACKKTHSQQVGVAAQKKIKKKKKIEKKEERTVQEYINSILYMRFYIYEILIIIFIIHITSSMYSFV